MNSTQWTNIIGDIVVILGLIANYLKSRSVGKAVAAQTPPTPPKT